MARNTRILDGPRMAYGPVRLERTRRPPAVLPVVLGLICLVLATAIVFTLAARYGWFPVPGWLPVPGWFAVAPTPPG